MDASGVSGVCYNLMIIFQVDLIVETKVNGILNAKSGIIYDISRQVGVEAVAAATKLH